MAPALLDDDLAALVGRLVTLAHALSLERSAARVRMVRIAGEDPDPQVRAVFAERIGASPVLTAADAFERIRGVDPSDPATLAFLARQLADTSASLSLRQEAGRRLLRAYRLVESEPALRRAGPALAVSLIQELAQMLTRPHDDAMSAEDREDRAAGGPPAELMSALPVDVRARLQQHLARICRQEPRFGAGLLIEVFERIKRRLSQERVAYLEAIAASGDSSVSERLVAELYTPYEDVQLAVVDALAAVGELPAVSALEPLTAGLFRAGQLKESARKAIATIRARAGARSLPGALSLADDAPAGALSLPADKG